MRYVLISCLVILLIGSLFFVSKPNQVQTSDQAKPVYGVESYDLSETEKRNLIVHSKLDAGESAYRLYQYYYFHEDAQESEALEWLKKAAKKRYLPALYSLGVIFETRGDLEQAKKYLKMAADRGDTQASQALKRLEQP